MRRAARHRAAEAADALVGRLREEAADKDSQLKALLGLQPDTAAEVVRRLAEAVPDLAAKVEGRQEAGVRRLHRNVGLHSDVLPPAGAPARCWHSAQRGPRLEARALRPRRLIPVVDAMLWAGPPPAPAREPPDCARPAFAGQVWDVQVLERFVLQPG